MDISLLDYYSHAWDEENEEVKTDLEEDPGVVWIPPWPRYVSCSPADLAAMVTRQADLPFVVIRRLRAAFHTLLSRPRAADQLHGQIAA